MALVMGTIGTLCMPLIVAMAMKDAFVTQFFPSTEASGGDMIDFHTILVFEEQSTPFAFSLLFSQQQSQGSTKHVVIAQALTPVQKVAIIWAGSSFHFHVSLDMRLGVIPEL